MNAKIMGTGYELPAFRADNDYLAGTGATDNKNIFISRIFRLLWSAGHHKSLRLCQKDIIFKHRIHIWLYVFGVSP